MVIGLEKPDLAILEIVDEPAVLLGVQFAGPDDFRIINVGGVVDPFLADDVEGA